MNLRYYRNHSTLIAKLADQAHEEMVVLYAERMKTEYPGDVIFYDMFNQRFAELILKECYDHCKDQVMDKRLAESEGLTYNDGVGDCAIGLLQHFGVN